MTRRESWINALKSFQPFYEIYLLGKFRSWNKYSEFHVFHNSIYDNVGDRCSNCHVQLHIVGVSHFYPPPLYLDDWRGTMFWDGKLKMYTFLIGSVINYLVVSLTLVLLMVNLANTKWCKKPEKLLKPWHMGTHLRAPSDKYPMKTNMIGFRWFSKIFASLCFGWK